MALVLLLAGLSLSAAPSLARPAALRGAEAKTLVLYADTRAGYQLENGLELLKVQLQRVATRLEALPLAEASPVTILAAGYVVVYCPRPEPKLGTNFLQTIATARQPVLWIGYGPDQLEIYPAFVNQFRIAPFNSLGLLTNAGWRSRGWWVPVAPVVEASLPPQSAAEVLVTLRDPKALAPYPLCWKTGPVTFFGALPDSGRLGQLFGDVLLDFYGVRQVPQARLYLRIEDVSCRSNLREFRRAVDYLFSREHSFVISVTPGCPANEAFEDLEAQPEFVSALRYAQARGGRLVLRGYGPNPASGYEFWDPELDRPAAQATAAFTRQRLLQGVRQMWKHGLFPVAWQAPQYAAAGIVQAEVARVFSTTVGRLQLSDATERDAYAPPALTLDRHGRLIVPENLGFVAPEPDDGLSGITNAAAALFEFRGVLGGCVIHPYQPFVRYVALVEALEGLGVPFLDLGAMDHAVQVPGGVWLAGQAERRVKLAPSTSVQWKAFNRAGQLLASETEPTKTTGDRTFRRRGLGDYELFEWSEATP